MVRDALYKHPALIDAYLKRNPQNFSADELAIIKSWQHFVEGDFYIERYLKKHAIFIKGNAVYAVLGLNDPLEAIIPRYRLPHYAKAVLLPYKGQIIYDGLLRGYSVFFGGGIKGELKETYMAAKQNGYIIESLERDGGDRVATETAAMAPAKPAKDWGPTVEKLAHAAHQLRATRDDPAIYSPTFSVAKAALELTTAAVTQPEDTDALWKALKKVERALGKTATVLNRMDL